MNAIGFKNFRRFKEMEPIKLGGVNMFVGGNNAGKSTVVKGILLLLDFLQYKKVSYSESPRFRFDGPGAHDVNIDTFNRALCLYAEEKEIVFNAQINEFTVEVCIYSARDTKEEVSYADVKYITLIDSQTNIRLDFDIAPAKATVTVLSATSENDSVKDEIKNMRTELEELQDRQTTLTHNNNLNKVEVQELLEISQSIGRLKSMLSRKKDLLTAMGEKKVTVHLLDGLWDNCTYISNYIHGLIQPRTSSIDEPKGDSLERRKLIPYQNTFLDIDSRFEKAVSSIRLEYVYSHDAGQRVLYNKKDENDYVSKSIHEFYNQLITSETKLGKEMKSWLSDFCGVDDYEVKNVNGEAYRFTLKKDGKWVDLADMGRGTIQLTTLLVRIFSIIQKYTNEDRMLSHEVIVLVEEPEQNLHPALQSKLTDLFYSVYKDHGIRFIIETHSEYMVRKSQVIVKTNIEKGTFSLVNNPLNVYFFDKVRGPYEMIYREGGRFSNEFGSTFYEEASKLAFDLF